MAPGLLSGWITQAGSPPTPGYSAQPSMPLRLVGYGGRFRPAHLQGSPASPADPQAVPGEGSAVVRDAHTSDGRDAAAAGEVSLPPT